MSHNQLFAITQLIVYHQSQKPTKKNLERIKELKQQRRELEKEKPMFTYLGKKYATREEIIKVIGQEICSVYETPTEIQWGTADGMMHIIDKETTMTTIYKGKYPKRINSIYSLKEGGYGATLNDGTLIKLKPMAIKDWGNSITCGADIDPSLYDVVGQSKHRRPLQQRSGDIEVALLKVIDQE